MRIELATESGTAQRPNEDFAAAVAPASGQGGALVPLDGVTPPAEDFGCAHDAPWFTARLGDSLTELPASRRGMTLAEILSESIRHAATAHLDTCDLSHARTPQATVVLARWDNERVEHLVLSDSVLLIEAPDGSVAPVAAAPPSSGARSERPSPKLCHRKRAVLFTRRPAGAAR
jgi:hypothetical protein